MSLSEKRKELYEENKKLCQTEDERLLVENIFLWLDKQDKEFIKDVEIYCQKGFVEESVVLKAEDINLKILGIINKIKKRAGEELTKDLNPREELAGSGK